MFITKEVCFWALKQDLKKTSELVKEIEIFDIYRTDFDDPKKQNSIAIGMRIEFQSMTKSLLNQEIEKEVKKIEEVLISRYDVTFK
jgi:phenylalanyl-tRNA synthetase beta subunit